MKCPHCGSPMGLEDRFCAYCGRPNEQAIEHQRDMDRFDAEYQDTKEHVFRRTEILRHHGSILIIMVISLIGLVGAVSLNAFAWDIAYNISEKESRRYLAEDRKVLREYLDAGDYGKFVGYYDSNNMDSEIDREYLAVYAASMSYTRLFEYISAIDNPLDYFFREDNTLEACTSIADELVRIFNIEKEYDHSYSDYLAEDKMVYINDIQERASVIAMTYFGLTENDVKEIPNISESKLAEIIKKGLDL